MTNESTETLVNIIKKGFVDTDITENDVPSIDLYMDQIITLLDSGLAGERRNQEDKLITKTMINNYSKDGLLHRIKGKTYTKQHILMILLIYNLKQSLSIADISRLFSSLEEQISSSKGTYNPSAVSALYKSCVDSKMLAKNLLPGLLSDVLTQLDTTDESQEAAAAVIALSALSNLFRKSAEQIIDNYF